MKKSEIKVGKTYSDGKHGVREVVAEGPDFTLHGGQQNLDCVRYKLIAKKNGPGTVGWLYNCTVQSFANWAKKEVASNQT